MRVTVDYLGHIKRLMGVERAEEIELEDGNLVRNLLILLAKKHGEPFKKAVYEPGGADLKSNFILMVNGLLLNQLEGIETPLKEGDRVVLMPIVSGG